MEVSLVNSPLIKLKSNRKSIVLAGIFSVSLIFGFYLKARQQNTHIIADENRVEVRNDLTTVSRNWSSRRQALSSPILIEDYKDAQNPSSAQAVLAKLSEMSQGPLDPLARANIDILIAAGAKSFPEELLAFLLRPESKHLQRTGMPTLFTVWAASGKQDALKAIKKIEPLDLRRSLELRLLLGLAEHDPELALTVMKENPQVEESDGLNMTSIYYEAYLRLGKFDFDSALESFSKMQGGIEREMALIGLVASATQNDIGSALDWCAGSPLGEDANSELLTIILRRGMLVNGKEALGKLEEFTVSGELGSQEVLSSISSNLPELVGVDFLRTFKMIGLTKEVNSWHSRLYVNCFEEFCKQNPSQAVSMFDKIQSDPFYVSLASNDEVASGLSAIVAMTESQTNPSNYRELLEGVDLNMSDRLMSTTNHLLATQGGAFASFLMEQSLSGLSSDNLELYLSNWITQEPDLAYQWVEESLPEGVLRENLTLEYDFGRAIEHPEQYRDALLESDYSESNRKLTEVVAGSLTIDSPLRAAEWAEELDDVLLKNHAVDAVSKGWLRADSYAAGEWIGSLPEGEARTIAIRNLVEAIEEVDPAAAQEWAESIGE